MYFSNKFYFSLLIVFLLQLNYRVANPVPDDDDDDDEEVVPEEPPEQVPQDSGDGGGSPSLSQSAIDEYLKEHPEARSLVKGNTNVKMKRSYDRYGNIVMTPDLKPEQKQTAPGDQRQMKEQIQRPPYPNPSVPFDPYVQNPYYNQMMQQNMQTQIQTTPVQGPFHLPPPPQKTNGTENNEVNQEDNMDSKIDELLKLAQSYPSLPNQTGMVNFSFPAMMPQMMPIPMWQGMGPMQGMPPMQGMSPMQGMPPMQSMPPMQGMPFMQSMPPINGISPMQPKQQMMTIPGFVPVPGNPYYQMNPQNMQIVPMPFGNVVGMDPKLMEQLESGKAQLDMANAKIVPYDTTDEPQEDLMDDQGTESDTLEDRPELPEVVIPKPKKKKRKHRKGKNGKPYFIMRARLKDLPNANQTGKDGWWTKSVPDYCFEEITEITNCKEKKKAERRWSFNTEDEKCYLYEDECFSLKLNTFTSLKDCMTTCWRPKK